MTKATINFRNTLINVMTQEILNKYGAESPAAISFCLLTADSKNLTLIKKVYQKMIKNN